MYEMCRLMLTWMTACLAVSTLTAGCRCTSESAASKTSADAQSPEAKLLARGKIVYASTCIACHNPNPKMAGSIGPEVFGSSKTLLTARIMHAGYPEGYLPKRQSHIMPQLPQVSADIDALAAYLNTP